MGTTAIGRAPPLSPQGDFLEREDRASRVESRREKQLMVPSEPAPQTFFDTQIFVNIRVFWLDLLLFSFLLLLIV